ncbi:undecaprenyldiphospho-muramoylpentapeptide beta-N-acetylglucosaminyltransferase [Arsukibacterium sp.]|uniref:undecaprenyldiphospho-muramoylpentapeptide beta-N-acetylglucosaminyltransferase n=1 Tax=Arsukibacterium sp. TaxID=1977258 RepID=UPI002FDAF7D5
MTKPHVLIMAGGTGGHIFPAQAVASTLDAAGWQVSWLGTADRMEAQLVPKFGWPFYSIEVRGLRGKSWRSVLSAPFMLAKACWQARNIIRSLQPQLVLGFGGYASGPGGLAAWCAGTPLVIHEQNAVAGSTNRLLARLATKVLVAFPQAFSGAKKQQLVGNPVRAELINCRAQALAMHQEQVPLKILVLGGSLGAKALNEQLPAQFARLAENKAVAIRHQTGAAMLQQVQQSYRDCLPADNEYEVSAFIEDMAAAYCWADVVICRAGALTVSEVASAGVAAVFVPLPGAIDDHQTANANWLVSKGAARLVPQSALTYPGIVPMFSVWLDDRKELIQMAAAARSLALDDASEQVAAVCRQVTGLAV